MLDKSLYLWSLLALAACLSNTGASAAEYGPLVRTPSGRGVYVVSPDFDQLAAITPDRIKEVIGLINKKIGNDLDSIFILNNQNDLTSTISVGYFGINYRIQNRTSGLGLSVDDSSGFYGARPRLRSVMHLPYRTALLSGPTLHEFMHIWANLNFINTTVDGHWGFSSANGQLGGFSKDSLQQTAPNTWSAKNSNGLCFGTFANGGNGVPYSQLELYLMGLLPASAVEPIVIAHNPVSLNNAACEFTADFLDTALIDQLVGRFGKRFPASDRSQKRFDVLFLLISTTTPTETQLAEFDSQIEEFTRLNTDGKSWLYNFWEATRGLARMVPVDIATASPATYNPTTVERLLSWAEHVLPDFFPAESRERITTPLYDYACYKSAYCLGLDKVDDVHFYDGKKIVRVGAFTDLANYLRIEGF